ncbi:hypothetical protein QLL95_gp0062 [Cotonvirus japonicus]|uniref:Uncharacterized protein n=1 Tax=Cotonvirus japonicus TaxID=2811091 RepID=A0ABM7NQW7_9VIRU|nr:hypothetical protein QLL95_gp0062 [Cotonvirus japonicus]BCS82551.1 hypothetical protein [Cotonvirus japonicus]
MGSNVSRPNKIDLDKYKHKEYLPDGRIKVKRHNICTTRCCRGCWNPDCYHGELGYINEEDQVNNYFIVDQSGKIEK